MAGCWPVIPCRRVLDLQVPRSASPRPCPRRRSRRSSRRPDRRARARPRPSRGRTGCRPCRGRRSPSRARRADDSSPVSSSGIEYPGPPEPVPVGSPPWITSIDVSSRWIRWPSKYPSCARKTKEFTVSGAWSASSSTTIVPHDVWNSAVGLPLLDHLRGRRELRLRTERALRLVGAAGDLLGAGLGVDGARLNRSEAPVWSGSSSRRYRRWPPAARRPRLKAMNTPSEPRSAITSAIAIVRVCFRRWACMRSA